MRDKHKARMIEVAVQILETDGLAGLQARRVAQECGCSVGTLYNTFNGLDDLIVHANTRTLDQLNEELRAIASDGVNMATAEGLMALALAYCRFAHEHQMLWRSVFEHRPGDGWVAPDWYVEKVMTLLRTLERGLVETVPDDEWRQRGARVLFSAVHGLVTLALDQKLGEIKPAEIEEQVRFIVSAGHTALSSARPQTATGPTMSPASKQV